MKTLCSLIAFISVATLCMLIAGGFFELFYLRPHVQINLPIPAQTSTAYDPLDHVQLDCLAHNIFFEARGESAKGKAMVGFVVMERTLSPHFPHTICGVVHQANTDKNGKIIKYKCSFSWYCDGKEHYVDFHNPISEKEWQQSYLIAKLIMLNQLKAPIDMAGVTNYHASYVKPFWSKDHKNFRLVAKIGDHLFYRWRKATYPKIELASN